MTAFPYKTLQVVAMWTILAPLRLFVTATGPLQDYWPNLGCLYDGGYGDMTKQSTQIDPSQLYDFLNQHGSNGKWNWARFGPGEAEPSVNDLDLFCCSAEEYNGAHRTQRVSVPLEVTAAEPHFVPLHLSFPEGFSSKKLVIVGIAYDNGYTKPCGAFVQGHIGVNDVVNQLHYDTKPCIASAH